MRALQAARLILYEQARMAAMLPIETVAVPPVHTGLAVDRTPSGQE